MLKKILAPLFMLCLFSPAAAWGKNSEVDVDLTALNSMMVYAEVYHILLRPEEYLGKTIKMNGLYYSANDKGVDYHFVVITDALACCQQGMEFVWNGAHKYPEDYPEQGTTVEMAGVFESYAVLDKTYYRIAVDDVIALARP